MPPARRDVVGGTHDDAASSCDDDVFFVPDAYARHAAQAHMLFFGLFLPLLAAFRNLCQVTKAGIPLCSKAAAHNMAVTSIVPALEMAVFFVSRRTSAYLRHWWERVSIFPYAAMAIETICFAHRIQPPSKSMVACSIFYTGFACLASLGLPLRDTAMTTVLKLGAGPWPQGAPVRPHHATLSSQLMP